jgi:hypothetical protein
MGNVLMGLGISFGKAPKIWWVVIEAPTNNVVVHLASYKTNKK